jgi:sigma-E factor negative regulatory protein RseA
VSLRDIHANRDSDAMTEVIKEQLSAWTDGELPAAEERLLHERLLRDADLKATAARYQLLRDVLRAQAPARIRKDFAAQVAHAVAGLEPAGRARRPSLRWVRPLAGVAIAASVAMVAVYGLVLMQPAGPAEQALAAARQPLPERSGWEAAQPAVASRLDAYLVQHSSVAGGGALQGALPYSRVTAGETRD